MRRAVPADKIGAIAAAALVLAALVWWWTQPDDLTDEEQIRQVIHQVAEGARAADLEETFAPIAKDYKHESFDRKALKAYVFNRYRKSGAVSVVLGPIDVRITEDKADAMFEAALADGVDLASFDLVPDNADMFDFVVKLNKREETWLIVGHHHKSGSGAQLR